MRGEVVLEIRGGVMQRYLMLLEQRVHLKAGIQFQEPADLSLSQCARASSGVRDAFMLVSVLSSQN